MPSRNKTDAPDSSEPEGAPSGPDDGAERRPTFIAPSLHFTGEIRSGGAVRIEGRVTGKVRARTLCLDRRGAIEGEVVAETAEIDGFVEGDLTADKVVLGASARVVGDITHRSLSMSPGAQFEGRVVQVRPSAAAKSSDGTVD